MALGLFRIDGMIGRFTKCECFAVAVKVTLPDGSVEILECDAHFKTKTEAEAVSVKACDEYAAKLGEIYPKGEVLYKGPTPNAPTSETLH